MNIGANDGRRFDRLGRFIDAGGWSGLMVEPDPVYFDELLRNYGDNPRIAFARMAVTDHDGHVRFYATRPGDGFPEWVKGMGSLNPRHLEQLESVVPGLATVAEPIEVPCTTLPALMRANDIDRVDVLAIDTEGHDWICLKQLADIDARPRVVIWETVNLDADDLSAAHAFMTGRGYDVIAGGEDSLAVDRRDRSLRLARWLATLRTIGQ